MPKHQHHNKSTQYYSGGANTDTGIDFLGQQEGGQAAKGEYWDGKNQNIITHDGKNFSSKKIKGETLHHERYNNDPTVTGSLTFKSGTWRCIGSVTVKNRLVEFWAEANNAEPIIKIDGIISARSSKLPFLYTDDLQIDYNDGFKEGEVFVNNQRTTPFILDIEDILKNAGKLGGTLTQKYFTEFELGSFILNIETQNDTMVFDTLSDVGINNGLPTGQYVYKFRYIDSGGNKAVSCVPTMPIPVYEVNGNGGQISGLVRSQGGEPNPEVNTKYAIKLRFRITNLYDYTGLEILRISHNAGQPIGHIPNTEIIYTIEDLKPNEIDVITFLDGETRVAKDKTGKIRGSSEANIVVTDESDTEQFQNIESVNAMRYFDSRLVLGGIKYASDDVDAGYSFGSTNSRYMYPVLKNLTEKGYADPYNVVNFKSYMRGERYGFSIVPIDGSNRKGYAKFVTGSDNSAEGGATNEYKNYKMPHRRLEIAQTASITHSYGGIEDHVDSSNEITKTFEAVGHGQSRRSDISTTKNIAVSLGAYSPYTPKNPSDTNTDGNKYRNVLSVDVNSGTTNVDYNPKGFNQNIYSLGMAIHKIINIPSWIKAFMVGRTEPAKRIVAQGIGVYSMTTAVAVPSRNTKALNEILCYFPDIDSNIGIDLDVYSDMLSNNFGRYKIQVSSPVGFFTDIYNSKLITSGLSVGVDMITHAKVMYEDGTVNPTNNTSNTGNSGYVAFGKWRNTVSASNFSGNNGTVSGGDLRTFNIVSVEEKSTIIGNSGRGRYLKIRLNSNIYNRLDLNSGGDINDSNNTIIRDFHEPFYIINIIQEQENIIDSNIDTFTPTGTYVKMESVIGRSSGTNGQSFEIVDERWEDCVNSKLDANGMSIFNADNGLFIKGTDGIQRYWLDRTFKTPTQIAQYQTQISNFLQFGTNPLIINGNTVYGMYRHVQANLPYREKEITLYFGALNIAEITNPNVYIPAKDSLIIAKYNNKMPIRVFGGDTFIGDHIFCPVDMQTDNGSNETDRNQTFLLRAPFPYGAYRINPNSKYDATIALLAADSAAHIRQWAVTFTAETRINPYGLYGNHAEGLTAYPDISYVIRPQSWTPNATLAANNIHAQYNIDYPNEANTDTQEGRWRYGGIRFLPLNNIDYAKNDLSHPLFSKPETGVLKKTYFGNRLIWTPRRNENILNSEGLRSFPSTNIYDIEGRNGDIRYLWSTIGGNSGENLYIFNDNATYVAITNKKILTDITGSDIANLGVDESTFISNIIPIKDIGLPNKMWRSAASYYNTLFFCNTESVWKLYNNTFIDIGKEKYYSNFVEKLNSVLDKDKLVGHYDTKHNQYWLNIASADKVIDIGTFRANTVDLTLPQTGYIVLRPSVSNIRILLPKGDINLSLYNDSSVTIFIDNTSLRINPNTVLTLQAYKNPSTNVITVNSSSSTTDKRNFDKINNNKLFVWNDLGEGGYWVGKYDYNFDKYTNLKGVSFGSRDFSTYELDKGEFISKDGVTGLTPIDYEMIKVVSPTHYKDKEFIRISVNSNVKPENIYFLKEVGVTKDNFATSNIVSQMNVSTFGNDYLKKYDGYENYIPRDILPPYSRRQGKNLIFAIKDSVATDFELISTTIDYKPLK